MCIYSYSIKSTVYNTDSVLSKGTTYNSLYYKFIIYHCFVIKKALPKEQYGNKQGFFDQAIETSGLQLFLLLCVRVICSPLILPVKSHTKGLDTIVRYRRCKEPGTRDF